MNFEGTVLWGASLQGANLRNANLKGANLRQASLREADLRGANLEQARLWDVDFQKAHLLRTKLQEAELENANLSRATRLIDRQLAGAVVTGAQLPPDIAAFDGLARVEEISRIARPVFIGLLAGCVYSWLTIATTTDARLLTNSASSPLPIIGTEIPIVGFYWVAPILLLGVYVYLHLYLQRLWEGLADLPAVFPDGKPLNKKVYPWLLSGLVRAHFKLLKDERTLLSRLENGAVIFLAWWIVPVTVLMFWGRYLPRHEWFGTGLHIVLLVVSIGSAILLQRHAAATLRRDVTAFCWRRPWSDRRIYQGAVALGLGVVFALVSLGAIEGEARRSVSGVVLGGIATWVPYAFDRVGYRTYANLRETDVSTKPATWTGLAERPAGGLDNNLLEKARAELAHVKGAPLGSADLRYANADGAFLARANFNRANLQGADLLGANLVLADLFGADLQGANLGLANLQEANLNNANLEGANLGLASLQGASVWGANLQGADLAGAKGVTQEQLDRACGDDETQLPDYLADYQMKPCPTPAQSPSN